MESGAAKLRATHRKKMRKKKFRMKKRAENWGKTPLKRFYLSREKLRLWGVRGWSTTNFFLTANETHFWDAVISVTDVRRRRRFQAPRPPATEQKKKGKKKSHCNVVLNGRWLRCIMVFVCLTFSFYPSHPFVRTVNLCTVLSLYTKRKHYFYLALFLHNSFFCFVHTCYPLLNASSGFFGGLHGLLFLLILCDKVRVLQSEWLITKFDSVKFGWRGR